MKSTPPDKKKSTSIIIGLGLKPKQNSGEAEGDSQEEDESYTEEACKESFDEFMSALTEGDKEAAYAAFDELFQLQMQKRQGNNEEENR